MVDVVIDTNILIYVLDRSSIFHRHSKNILTSNEYNLFVTTKTISEFFAVASKHRFDVVTVNGFFKDLKKNTTFLFPDSDSLLIFETLLEKYRPSGNQVFDMEIVSVMLSNGLRTIATFNTSDFKDIQEIALLDTEQ